jgi:hypothetical protein
VTRNIAGSGSFDDGALTSLAEADGCGNHASYRWRCTGDSYGKLGGSIEGCGWVTRSSSVSLRR